VTERATPHYRTGTLWGVLTLFLLVGTVAAAFVVYGFTDLLKTGRWFPDLLELAAGGMVASLAMLLVTGILYRVDRLRGVPHRRVELFE
jgi:hypothetical protein